MAQLTPKRYNFHAWMVLTANTFLFLQPLHITYNHDTSLPITYTTCNTLLTVLRLACQHSLTAFFCFFFMWNSKRDLLEQEKNEKLAKTKCERVFLCPVSNLCVERADAWKRAGYDWIWLRTVRKILNKLYMLPLELSLALYLLRHFILNTKSAEHNNT